MGRGTGGGTACKPSAHHRESEHPSVATTFPLTASKPFVRQRKPGSAVGGVCGPRIISTELSEKRAVARRVSIPPRLFGPFAHQGERSGTGANIGLLHRHGAAYCETT